MPHVLEDLDVLEEDPVLSPTCDELHALTTAPHERSHVMTLLRRLITSVPRLRMRRQECGVSGARRFEAPLDKLAREQLDIYLLVMGGIG
jgi:hypothetical protein